MSQLIESIWIKNRRIKNIFYHQERFLKSMNEVFDIKSNVVLRNHISTDGLKQGDVKCRIIYNQSGLEVSYSDYIRKPIHSVKLVVSDEITYSNKYFLRPDLDKLFTQREGHDEIIILKNGLLTDAYFYNLVLENKKGLFTPYQPLLKGTMRQRLLDKKLIFPKVIEFNHLSDYDNVHFINALNPIGKLMIKTSQLY